MLSAYFTWMLVIVHYLSRTRTSENPIDRWLTRRFRSRAPEEQSETAAETWDAATEASVLLFSDTQVITGMAILLCGYSQLADGLCKLPHALAPVDVESAWQPFLEPQPLLYPEQAFPEATDIF